MKIRTGFVSNSSSSSFIVQKKNLTEEQIHKIKRHELYDKYFANGQNQSDKWRVVETDETIELYTTMTNWDMDEFLLRIGVSPKHIDWKDY